ncbi:MAG: hypothetical protein HZB53_06020 [Chloroflexi bacterium]|nr:hypothetical protein [Chloroflexota bacterium]
MSTATVDPLVSPRTAIAQTPSSASQYPTTLTPIAVNSSTSTPTASPQPAVVTILATSGPTKITLPTLTLGSADPNEIFDSAEPSLNRAKDEALRIIGYNLLYVNWNAPGAPPRAHSAGDGYDSPWIRDSFAWGMIPTNVYSQLSPYTSSEIEYWLNLQEPSGQFASVLLSGYYDETPILIAAVVDAYRITGDRAQLERYAPALRTAWAWMAGHVDSTGSPFLVNALVHRVPGLPPPVAADWADQIARSGYAGQVNMLWYRATLAMATMEAELGNKGESMRYFSFAQGIKADIGRVLWATTAPFIRNAPPVAAFGHFRSWTPSERDYFEMDTNMLAIVYGIATTQQADSILGFVRQHADYLLGPPSGMPPPAKTVYGDYDPRDYVIFEKVLVRDGTYHNGYWIPIGGLAARAFAMHEQPGVALRIVRNMANAFSGHLADPSNGPGYEWYTASGIPQGAPAYQWSSRSLLHTLLTTYAGIDEDWDSVRARGMRVTPLAGGVSVKVMHLGKTLSITTHGSGILSRAVINNRTEIHGTILPEELLEDGTTIDLFLVHP